MFNLQGSEIIFILLIALVVLGPEKLPGAIKRVTQLYAEFRKMSSGFQAEFKAVVDEPIREMRETADLVRNAADPKKIAEEAEKAAEAEAAAAKAERAEQAEKAANADTAEAPGSSASGVAATTLTPVPDEPDPVDEWADPVDGGDDADSTDLGVAAAAAGAAREDVTDLTEESGINEDMGIVERSDSDVDDGDEVREESA